MHAVENGTTCKPAAQPEALFPRAERSLIRHPHQGLEPVGKGHAAAGFRAVFAPSGVVAIEDTVVVDPAIAAACFVAAFLAVFRFDFFPAAFLAGFFSDLVSLSFLLPSSSSSSLLPS